MSIILKIFMVSSILVVGFSCQSRNQIETSGKKVTQNNHETIIADSTRETIKEDTTNDLIIYKVPDELAYFAGGEHARITFFNRHLYFDFEENNSDDFFYLVFLQFVVELDSSISNIKVWNTKNAKNEILNTEAIRVTKLGKWVPGRMNNYPVRSEFTLPIEFKSKN